MNTNTCTAIRNRAVVRFRYGGGDRIVEPYCHGISHPGNEVLRGYQTDGYSESGNPLGWKLFDVAKIVGLAYVGRSFYTNRPGYNPNDSDMSSVHCCV